MNDPLYLTYAFHNDQLIKFSQVEQAIDRSYLEATFRKISKNLDMEDSLCITFPRQLLIEQVAPVIEYIQKSNIKRVYFFVEDVLTVSCPYEFDHLDLTIIDRYPNDFSIREFEIIRLIIKETNVNNVVFHCEYNLGSIMDRYQDLNIQYFDIFVALTLSAVFQSKRTLDPDRLEYKICCFNHRAETYRTVVAALLYDMPDTLVTLGKAMSILELQKNRSMPLSKFDISIRQRIIANLGKIMNNGGSISWDIEVPSTYKMLTMQEQWNTINAINKSFCTLVTETRYTTELINFSEKTIKPILAKKPFVLLAPPNTLKFLRQLGFKTFDKWWDESYDDITDHNIRLEKVYSIIEEIIKKPAEELQQVLIEMDEILKYNFEHLQYLDVKMFCIND